MSVSIETCRDQLFIDMGEIPMCEFCLQVPRVPRVPRECQECQECQVTTVTVAVTVAVRYEEI